MTTLTSRDNLYNSLSHYVSVLTLDIAGVAIATILLKITEIVCTDVCVSVCACEYERE